MSKQYRIQSVIVTGSTGVTGNALVRYLLGKNIEVTALVRPESFRLKFLPQDNKKLTVIPCSMEKYMTISHRLMEKAYDVFFHLAWGGSMGKKKVANRDDFKMQNKNVSYALDAVELCHSIKCPTFIMAGSQAEYGRKDCAITEDMTKNPENGYGMAKLCAEGMTRRLCAAYGIRHIWPILFSVYGPYDFTESLIDTSIRGLLKGKRMAYTAGEQQWDYLYSVDAAQALLLLAQYGVGGEAYCVANGITKELRYYLQNLYHIVAPESEFRLGELPYAKNQVMFLGADITKLKETTGFVPKFSFREGIKEIKECLNNV